MDEKLPPQPEPVAQLDLLCIFGGMGCWYFAKEQLGESWALKILPRRAWAVQLCGAALMAGSVSLRTSSMERFRVHRTPLTHQQPSQVLVTDGPILAWRSFIRLAAVRNWPFWPQ
ncbi:unnamed protein product [Cladocopium goreaui]|uniref:Canalicular multispecific organic anion transporter 1 n=1 Tax=Cladocopium goreaui TaxID=2562237 RepID=A0A9P1G6J3_9DINO|nr:unnamed protein product [Cladocopium goreaui]